MATIERYIKEGGVIDRGVIIHRDNGSDVEVTDYVLSQILDDFTDTESLIAEIGDDSKAIEKLADLAEKAHEAIESFCDLLSNLFRPEPGPKLPDPLPNDEAAAKAEEIWGSVIRSLHESVDRLEEQVSNRFAAVKRDPDKFAEEMSRLTLDYEHWCDGDFSSTSGAEGYEEEYGTMFGGGQYDEISKADEILRASSGLCENDWRPFYGR